MEPGDKVIVRLLKIKNKWKNRILGKGRVILFILVIAKLMSLFMYINRRLDNCLIVWSKFERKVFKTHRKTRNVILVVRSVYEFL